MSEAPTIEPKELVENSGRPAVVVVDLHKSFGALEVLKGISLAARQGDVVSILGPSGSGKSTMLRCINLLETPDSGTIGVGEETLRVAKNPNGRVSVPDQRQVERLRRSTGMVFQRFNLWSHMTILQNVVEAPIHVLKRPRVFDDDGNRYIEGLSGLFCASLGFSEERLVEAATRQMRKLPFYRSFGHKTNEPSVELAERLIGLAPAPMSKVFFANSGSEANDTAVKLVWYYHNAIGKPQKKKIISRIRAYHGVTVRRRV